MNDLRLAVFEQRYIPEPTSGCWLWIGAITPKGYGMWGRKMAHRISYEHFKGIIPAGLEIDHLCRVRPCVNPQHLEAVTGTENKRRGFSPTAILHRKTVCRRDHQFDKTRLDKNGVIHRRCRVCERIAAQAVQ